MPLDLAIAPLETTVDYDGLTGPGSTRHLYSRSNVHVRTYGFSAVKELGRTRDDRGKVPAKVHESNTYLNNPYIYCITAPQDGWMDAFSVNERTSEQ